MVEITRTVRRRRRWWIPVIVVAVVLGLIAGVITMIAADRGPARSEPAGTIATAQVDGREVAVVVYKADTFPHPDLLRIESMGFSTQAEAFDLETGRRMWDTLLFAEFGGTEAEVLGMGSAYVYVRSAEGLLILDAATGEIVAREGEIDGVGEDYIAAIDAYAWDATTRSVVLLDANGRVLSIPADGLSAEDASAEVAQRWRGELNTESESGSVFSHDAWEQVEHRAPMPDGETVSPVWADAGWDVDVLLEDGTGLAAGWRDGFAVTQTYQPDSSDAYYVFQVGDLASGDLVGTVEAESSASAVTVSDAGRVVLLSDDDTYRGLLVVASPDGIRSSVIGERAFLGW